MKLSTEEIKGIAVDIIVNKRIRRYICEKYGITKGRAGRYSAKLKKLLQDNYSQDEAIEIFCKEYVEPNYKAVPDTHHDMTLCSKCGNYNCNWVLFDKPVKDWKAEPTITELIKGKECNSFCVKKCPEFVPAKPRIEYSDIPNYTGIVDFFEEMYKSRYSE